MRFSFWLRKGKRAASAARRRTQISMRQPANFRPRLETLEDRTLLSGGGPHPDHGGGLPYATAGRVSQLIADINYANLHGGTITINLKAGTTFDLSKVNNTTDGGNALPVIGGTKAVDLTINGNGDTIERPLNPFMDFRLLDVAPGASLTLKGVTLKGGWAGGVGVGADGGAIYNQGTLKVSNSTLSVNNAEDGGVIYNAGGTVTVSNSNFLGGVVPIGTNSEMTSNAATDSGGGIYNNAGTLTIRNSILSGSSAIYGGGIYNAGGMVALSNSILSGNSALTGAGIYNVGGTVTVSNNSTLSGNHAEGRIPGYGGPSGPGIGGGVYNSGGTVAINHSTLSDNFAQGYGGGIDNAGGTVKVSNSSTLSGNSAAYGGGIYITGGTVTVNGCTLSGNSAGGGGGIYNLGGMLTVGNSDFENNSPDNIYGLYTDDGGNTGL